MIYLGTSGWYYKHWIGNFYPQDLDQNKWLEYYSEKFNSVEVNSSFYRLPFKNMIKGWINRTPDDFKLTFKGSQIITHRKKLKDIDEYLNRFHERIKIAEDRIGVILWQLPPTLKKDINLLENFLNSLKNQYKQCIEFRHNSWFKNEIYNIFKKYDIAFCVVSAPGLNEDVEITSNFAYFRWHGINNWYNYNYSKQELYSWAVKIKKLDVENIYGYFNNDYNAYAPKNCLELKRIIES